MKTRILWTSMFGLLAASSAQAQSSVTLYGLLDVAPAAFKRTTAANERMYKLNSDTGSSSRFGLRGVEDLGDGLSAYFNLEAPIDLKNGVVGGGASSGACNASAACAASTTPAFWRRNAYVGLRGKFGEVSFGRYYTASIIKQAPTLSATPSGINTGMGSALLAQGLSNDFWNSNQIRYDSPKFGPIDFAVHMSAGEAAGGNKAGSTYGGNVRYAGGPLTVSLSAQQDMALLPAQLGKKVTWWIASGSYAFGAFKVHAGYDSVDNSDGVTGFVDSKLLTVGASFQATPFLVVAAQYWTIKEEVGAHTKSKLLVLNADYALSKRSFLYAMYGHVDNKDLGIAPLWGNQNFSGAGNVVLANAKNQGLAVGIRHVF